jgi:hypothetical protein
MYDWLQAFLAIVNPNESGDEQRDVPPEIQYPLKVYMSVINHSQNDYA